ncbi:MAG: LamG-like jellyroll fold domain-containing protein, partial [Flavobacteriales bacterium]
MSTAFSSPMGIVRDASGNTYVAERVGAGRVRKLAPDGTISTYCTSGLSSDLGDLAIDNSGGIYVGNYTAGTVAFIPPGGGPATVYAGGFDDAFALALDPATGVLYVGAYFTQKIWKVLPGGGMVGGPNVIPIIGTPQGISGSFGTSHRLVGLGIEPSGSLIATVSWSPGKVYRITTSPVTVTLLATGGTLVHPTSPKIDPATGDIYMPDYYACRVHRMSPSGSYVTYAGMPSCGNVDGPAAVASLYSPYFAHRDPDGTLWISQYDGRIRRISKMSTGPAGGLALDLNGTSAYVNLTGSTAITFGPQVSMEAWIYPREHRYQEIIGVCDDPNSACTGTDYKATGIRLDPAGRLEIYHSHSVWSYRHVYAGSSGTVPLNRWTHVAATVNLITNTATLYLNGIPQSVSYSNAGTGTGSYSGKPAIGALQVTGWTTTMQYPFSGMIDEVRIWNGILPQSSIRDYMCRNNIDGHPQIGNILAYYHIEDGIAPDVFIQDAVTMRTGVLTGTTVSTGIAPSSAPMGTTSAHDYAGTGSVSLSGSGLNMTLATSGVPMQLYHVPAPGQFTPPSPEATASDAYFGTVSCNQSNPTCTAEFNYGGVPSLASHPSEDHFVLLRNNQALGPWSTAPGTVLNTASNSIQSSATHSYQAQFMLGLTGCTTDLDFVYQADGIDALTWELREQGTNILMQSGGGLLVGNGAEATCLPDGCFYLVVTDDGGDGIVNGGYLLKVNSAERLIDNLHDAFGQGGFTSGATSQI